MTKMIKMSLIAATAVASMSSVATAGSLEDAIKGVDVSGYVDYRKEYKSTEGVKKADVNEYAVNVTATSKVNDTVKATLSIGFDEVQTINTGTGNTSGYNTAHLVDANPGLSVSNAYFTFDLGAAAVMAGKQNIPSVFVDEVDTAKTGTGIVASTKVGGLTLAGAHFTSNNIAVNTKTTELIAAGGIAGINAQVNYNMTDIAGSESKRMYLKVGTDVAGVNLGAEYANADIDGEAEKATNLKVYASGKVSNVSLTALYGKAGKYNSNSNSVAIDSDNDAKAQTKVWQLSTDTVKYNGADVDVADATIMMLAASVPLTDTVKGGLKYATADLGENDAKASEMLLTVDYKMSKNFLIHARYSELTVDPDASASEKTKYSRIQVRYTF